MKVSKNFRWLLYFLGAISTVLVCGCEELLPTTPKRELPTNTYIIGDFSTTQAGSQIFDSIQAIHIPTIFSTRQSLVLAGHVSQPHADPAVYISHQVPPEANTMELDYLEKKAERDSIIKFNQRALLSYQQQYRKKFTEFTLTPETDYSYINRHLQALYHFLSDTSYQANRIAVIATDFMNHEKGSPPGLADTTILHKIHQLVLGNPRRDMFIISDDLPPELQQFGFGYFSTWTEFNNLITNRFTSSHYVQN